MQSDMVDVAGCGVGTNHRSLDPTRIRMTGDEFGPFPSVSPAYTVKDE